MSEATRASECTRASKELAQAKAQVKKTVLQMEAIKEFKEGLQTNKLKGLLYKFDYVYEHWKVRVKIIEKYVINKAPLSILQENVDAIEKDQEESPKSQVRRFEVPQDCSTSYIYLKEKLRSLFGQELGNSGINITWKDQENDTITIESDDELLIAMQEMKGPVYKFCIFPSKVKFFFSHSILV